MTDETAGLVFLKAATERAREAAADLKRWSAPGYVINAAEQYLAALEAKILEGSAR